MNKVTFRKFIREFWIQAILSLGWGSFQTYELSSDENSITVFITNFSAAFFLLSWLFGQFVRIRKQQKIEDEFKTVKAEIRKLLQQLKSQTEDFMGFALGGDSYAYLLPSLSGKKLGLRLINQNKYPVYDIAIEWIDLNEKIDPSNNKLWTRHEMFIGDIYPSKISNKNIIEFNENQLDNLNINFFIRARNMTITQALRVRKVNNKPSIAYRISVGKKKTDKIPKDFPEYDPNDPDKVFK